MRVRGSWGPAHCGLDIGAHQQVRGRLRPVGLRSAGIRPHLIADEHHASESILRDGLYRYDTIGRLQEANLREIEAGTSTVSRPSRPNRPSR